MKTTQKSLTCIRLMWERVINMSSRTGGTDKLKVMPVNVWCINSSGISIKDVAKSQGLPLCVHTKRNNCEMLWCLLRWLLKERAPHTLIVFFLPACGLINVMHQTLKLKIYIYEIKYFIKRTLGVRVLNYKGCFYKHILTCCSLISDYSGLQRQHPAPNRD